VRSQFGSSTFERRIRHGAYASHKYRCSRFLIDCQIGYLTSVKEGIKDFHGLIDEISRILRPGGLILLREPDLCYYGEDQKETLIAYEDPNHPQHSWFVYMSYITRNLIKARGGDVECAHKLKNWLEEHKAFRDAQGQDIFFPVAPYFPGMNPSWPVLHRDIHFTCS
jgi:predicted SAM-dependent methyltransferase